VGTKHIQIEEKRISAGRLFKGIHITKMEKVAKFHIIDSFKITGRGLVPRGNLLE